MSDATKRALKIIAIIVLGALGLFTGGCSLFFMLGMEFFPELHIPGFLVAGVCLWAVIALIRSFNRPPPPE